MLKVQNDKKQLIIAITNHELAVKKKYYAIPVPITIYLLTKLKNK